ncbi:MAG: carbohydrate ABC transporter permease [Clostridiales bacterium]|nr:carbohydrate ABC transporter permease [Clostridiales bacterium]
MAIRSRGERLFDGVNVVIMFFLAIVCLVPFVHIAALSLSAAGEAAAGRVGLWPVRFTLSSYTFALQKPDFVTAFFISVQRVVLGAIVNMGLLVVTAYPLSKRREEFPGRSAIAWYFVVTMFLGGGMIPTYIIVTSVGLKNTIWALIVPGAVSVYNMLVLMSFYRTIPKELDESALIDGASTWTVLLRIYIPLSLPALATLTLYTVVGHWNEWFSALIYIDNSHRYPLQTYLQNFIVQPDFTTMDKNQLELLLSVNTKTFRAAQIIIATVPILCVYPFLQKYFIKGMTLGAVKG